MKKWMIKASVVSWNTVTKAKKVIAEDRGGVSPLVVTIGLALLLLGVIIAFSSTLRQAVSDAINNVISKLNSLN